MVLCNLFGFWICEYVGVYFDLFVIFGFSGVGIIDVLLIVFLVVKGGLFLFFECFVD